MKGSITFHVGTSLSIYFNLALLSMEEVPNLNPKFIAFSA